MKKHLTPLFCCALICAICFAFGCTGGKQAGSKSRLYDGTWVPVAEEIGGTALPPAAFATQKLEIVGNAYTMTAESVDKGELKYDGDKMDIYGKEGVNAGKHFMALYKFENEQLTICYNLKGDSYPTAFATKGQPLFFMATFKKQGAR